MNRTMLSSSGLEPLSLSEVKQFLRLDSEDEDALLSMWIAGARESCEAFTGRALITQEWQVSIDAKASVELNPGPVQEVISVEHVEGENRRTLDVSEYRLERNAGLDEVFFDSVPRCGVVEITFRSGFGTDWNNVPLSLRQGMLRLVSHNYRFRDAVDTPSLPAAVMALWQPFRVLRL